MPKIVTLIIILALVVLVVFLAAQWVWLKIDFNQLQKTVKIQQTNQKTLEFANFFVDKVLLSSQQVSFEERLQMENMVRDINDQQILDQWNKFVKSDRNEDVQKELVNLLKLLLSKIST